MSARQSVIAGVLLLFQAQLIHAQNDGVRLARIQDPMFSGRYAYVRAETGIIERIDDRGIHFSDRDPALVWACVSDSLVVVYRYDTELIGQDGVVHVQYRFDDRPPSSTQSWTGLRGKMTQEMLEFTAGALAGPDSASLATNPLVQAFLRASIAAEIPRNVAGEFLTGARNARTVTFRVTDPVDEQSHLDVFPLMGLSAALDTLSKECTR